MTDDPVVRVAARGDGVTASGRYVAGAAPGDAVLTDGTLVAGPHRAVPPCPQFGRCGGCALQHLDDVMLAQFVAERVLGPLAGKGIVPDQVAPVHLSPPRSRRRAMLAWRRRRGRLVLGFRAAASHDIVNVEECTILAPRLHDVMPALSALLRGWPGGDLGGSVELSLIDQGVDIAIDGVAPTSLAEHEALTAFAQRLGLARLSLLRDGVAETQWEPEPATIGFGALSVPFPHGAFLQATADGEAALVHAASAIIGDAAMVADLFAGLGCFAGQLMTPGRRIYAAEAAQAPVLALKRAAAAAQAPIFADHRDLYRRPLQPEELNRFGAVVIDPPRAGAEAQSIALAGSSVPAIAAISCNPATFARDAAILCGGGYRLRRLWPVGQFRWSLHVELAAEFVR